MRLDNHAVFLASRFTEFSALRRALRERLGAQDRRVGLLPIDLNDGAATHLPPLVESIDRLRRARFMILLLGENYGDAVEGQTKSYVNLEYEAALQTEGEIRVLAFGIGPSYAGGRIAYSGDPRLAAFQRQVELNHTMGFFAGSECVDEQAEAIFQQLVYAVCDLRSGPPHNEEALVEAGIEPDDLLEDEEVESLEHRYGNAGTTRQESVRSAADALAQPAELAAREQCREADKAIKLGVLRLARDHLRRAVELRPLDVEANYRLARLYIASGQRKYLTEAIERLDIVRRTFERDEQRYRVCDCLLLQAKALMADGDSEAALALAKTACAEVPGYGRACYEHACLLLVAGNSKAARTELFKAVKRYFPLWPQALRDPRLAVVIERAREDVERWLNFHRDMARFTLETESLFAEKMRLPPSPLPDLEGIRNPNTLGRLSCGSIRRQHRVVSTELMRTFSAMVEADESLDGSSAKGKRTEHANLQQKREEVVAELAQAQRSVSFARVGAAVVAGLIVVLIFAWSLLPSAFANVSLFLASMAMIPLMSRVSQQRVRDEQNALSETDRQLQGLADALQRLTEEARTMREAMDSIFLAWCGSLSRIGRHQPYAEIANIVKRGDLLVANSEELETLQQERGEEAVLKDPIAFPVEYASNQHRRLYRVLESTPGRLVLSEFDAYVQQQG